MPQNTKRWIPEPTQKNVIINLNKKNQSKQLEFSNCTEDLQYHIKNGNNSADYSQFDTKNY